MPEELLKLARAALRAHLTLTVSIGELVLPKLGLELLLRLIPPGLRTRAYLKR